MDIHIRIYYHFSSFSRVLASGPPSAKFPPRLKPLVTPPLGLHLDVMLLCFLSREHDKTFDLTRSMLVRWNCFTDNTSQQWNCVSCYGEQRNLSGSHPEAITLLDKKTAVSRESTFKPTLTTFTIVARIYGNVSLQVTRFAVQNMCTLCSNKKDKFNRKCDSFNITYSSPHTKQQ